MHHAARTTLEEIDAAIRKVEYLKMPDGRTIICQITMDNGFTIRGESSCVSRKYFNAKTGERLAFEAARDKVWCYVGFRMHERLHQVRMKKAKGQKFRDADSGLYVTKEYATLNPKTTVRET